MSRDVREGWLLLADLSGYTRFITQADLETGHEVVEDLLRTLLRSLAAGGGGLKVVKLEGDAILCRADSAVSGAQILDRIEDSYHAFRMHLFTLDKQGRCACFSCNSAQALDLKFAVHHGSYVIHSLAGHEDVSGADVVTVHRLLKNTVKNSAYALFSASAMGRCPPALPFRRHVEHYEHLGEIECGVLNLELSYVRMLNTARLALQPDEADAETSWMVPTSSAEAWALHFDQALRRSWDDPAWTMSANIDGRMQPGATVSCTDLSCSLALRIVEWRPPVSVTFDIEADGEAVPGLRSTYVFEEVSQRTTKVTQRLKLREPSEAARRYLDAWTRTAAERQPQMVERLSRFVADRERSDSDRDVRE